MRKILLNFGFEQKTPQGKSLGEFYQLLLCYPPPNLAPFLPRILPSGHRNIRERIGNFLEGLWGDFRKNALQGPRNAKKRPKVMNTLSPFRVQFMREI